MNNKQKRNKGITLISLVITIIVILILAGISLFLILGENGILAQADNAVEMTEYGMANEKVEIAISGSYDKSGEIYDEDLITELNRIEATIIDKDGNKISDSEVSLVDKYPIKVIVDTYEFEILENGKFEYTGEAELSEKLEPGDIAGSNGAEYEDEDGVIVKIPEGAKISEVEEEQNIRDGLVMIDKLKNEWVWVEVPESIYVDPIVESSTSYSEIEENILKYVTGYTSGGPVYTDEWLEGFPLFNSKEEYDELKNSVLQSIYENKGFWVSRYEIGILENQPVSQSDKVVMNNMTINDAQTIAVSMGEKSTLMFGFQWDLILKFMEMKGNISSVTLKLESKYIGNYMDNINETIIGVGKSGEAENSEVLNINDIAGNVWEWTLETNTTNSKNIVYRGGNYSQYSQYFSAVRRLNNTNDYWSITLGIRTVLY